MTLYAQEITLTLLIDYCKKTIATVGGDGYEEIVLYFNNETKEYELHTYKKYQFMKDEEHHIFRSSKEQYDSIMQRIEDNKLRDLENVEGHSLYGGDYICKFKYGDRMIRITTANLLGNGVGAIVSIGNHMRACIDEQNEII